MKKFSAFIVALLATVSILTSSVNPEAVVVHVEYDLLLVTKTILVQGGTSITVEIFQIPTRI